MVHSRYAWRIQQTQAAIDGEQGLLIVTIEQLVARLAGGFLQSIDADDLKTAVAAAVAEPLEVSYHVAIRTLGLTAQHIDNKRANNRAENSHQPVRRRERKQQRFKSPGSAQRVKGGVNLDHFGGAKVDQLVKG